MKPSSQTRSIVAVLFAAVVTPVLAQQSQSPKSEFRFRGVVSGVTTKDELLKSSKWGTPESRTIHKSGDTFWEYRPRGYKKIVVMLRSGIVQSVDVTLPAGVTPEKAAEAFGLGKPATGKPPKPALVGGEVPKAWQPKPYAAGRVLLFVETANGKSAAKLMRIYADRVLVAAAAPAVALPDVKVTLTGQDDTSRRIVRKVVELLEQNHISGLKLDDKLAARWMGRFIKRLDPGKYFFLQSDVDRFQRLAEGIDDKARLGDIGFAYVVYRTFAQRRKKSMEFANRAIAAKRDFSADEKFVFPTKTTAYPENELESGEIWRKRIKYDILERKRRGSNDAEARDRVTRHYRQVFQLPGKTDDDELLAWCLADLATAFDPHSDYYSAYKLREFQTQLRAQFVGIGASLMSEDGYIAVVKVLPGSPAAKDGRLQNGDRIVGVAQGNGEFVDVVGKRMSDVVAKIRGKRGTVVRLKVIPKTGKQGRVYDITRGQITLQRIDGKIVTRKANGKEYRIGVVKVPIYYGDSKNRSAPSSTGDTRKVLEDLKAKKVDLVVLDFRSNSGGSLDEGQRFPGLFLPQGPLLQVKDAAGKVRLYNVGSVERAWQGPLVVLVNRVTASGAESFPAAVQDYGRGLVVGDSSTHGTGTVQNLLDVGRELVKGTNSAPPQLGVVRVTSYTMHRVTGQSWQLRGVVPDVIVPSVFDLPSYGEIGLGSAPPADALKPAAFRALHWIDADVRQHLAKRSQERRSSDAEFTAYLKAVRENAKWKSRTSAPLNEKKFLAAAREFEKATAALKSDATKRDPALNEALHVAVDYLGRIPWHRDYAEAMQLLRKRDYVKSAARFTAILAANANLKIARSGRALAYAGQGDWDAAVKEAREAGDAGVPCRVTKATSFRAGTETVAAAAAGTRVFVTSVSKGWLWARLPADPKTKGWIEKKFLVPATGE
jgi:carboxyl-terminal processing protease